MGALPDYWGWCLVGALVSPKQRQTSSARHTLSHATSSQPTAIPTPDDTPVSRPILAVISSPKFSHFLACVRACNYLFPGLISIHYLSLSFEGERNVECWWRFANRALLAGQRSSEELQTIWRKCRKYPLETIKRRTASPFTEQESNSKEDTIVRSEVSCKSYKLQICRNCRNPEKKKLVSVHWTREWFQTGHCWQVRGPLLQKLQTIIHITFTPHL